MVVVVEHAVSVTLILIYDEVEHLFVPREWTWWSGQYNKMRRIFFKSRFFHHLHLLLHLPITIFLTFGLGELKENKVYSSIITS